MAKLLQLHFACWFRASQVKSASQVWFSELKEWAAPVQRWMSEVHLQVSGDLSNGPDYVDTFERLIPFELAEILKKRQKFSFCEKRKRVRKSREQCFEQLLLTNTPQDAAQASPNHPSRQCWRETHSLHLNCEVPPVSGLTCSFSASTIRTAACWIGARGDGGSELPCLPSLSHLLLGSHSLAIGKSNNLCSMRNEQAAEPRL